MRTVSAALLAVGLLAVQCEARLNADSRRDLLEMDRRLLDKIEEYEVLDNMLGSHVHRRELAEGNLEFAFSALGKTHEFDLAVRRNLFDENFKNYAIDRHGKAAVLDEEKDCIYKGANKTVFSFCGGVVHGRFPHEDDFVHVKPLPSGRHVVFRRRHLAEVEPGHCGITKENEAKYKPSEAAFAGRRSLADEHHDHAHEHHVHAHLEEHADATEGHRHLLSVDDLEELATTPEHSQKRMLATSRNVDLLVFNDFKRYEEYGGSGVMANTAYIVSLVADLYDELPGVNAININLVAMFVFTEEDPYTISMTNGGLSVDASTLLNEFSDYARSELTTIDSYVDGQQDHLMLLSGYDFYDDSTSSSGVVGLAWVGGLCNDQVSSLAGLSSRNTAITQANFDDEKYVANIFTHELGHNLGMEHTVETDTSNAPSSPCNSGADEVMDPAASFDPEWSSCSHEYWNAKVSGTGSYSVTSADCTKAANDAVVHDTCGNGIVEDGEDCDCLLNDCTGIDECCNGATCEFAGTSTCSEQDPCCVKTLGVCSIQTDTAVVCRASADATCDPAPETCDGSNAKCPTDVVTASGTSCGTDGECFLGACVSIDEQCSANGYTSGGCGFTSTETGLFQTCNGYLRCQSSPTTCAAPPFYPANGSPCTSGGSDGQCYGRECITNAAELPTPADIEACSDGAQGGTETDVDCGGDFCSGCTAGKSCNIDDDCLFPAFCNETVGLCDVTDYYPNYDGDGEEKDWRDQLLGLWAKFLDWVKNNTAMAAGVFAAAGFILLSCIVSCCCCGGKEKTRQYAQQASFRMRNKDQQVTTATPYYN